MIKIGAVQRLKMSEVRAEDVQSGTFLHQIFITLKDKSEKAVQKQLELGNRYLTGHPGELSFEMSVLARGLKRHKQVAYLHNEQNFDVAFSIVWKDAASHDAYQTSDKHVKHFIPLSKSNWIELRVFDTEIK